MQEPSISDYLSAEDILNRLHEGIYITDKERRIVYWNQKAEEITGFRSQDIVGKRCCDNVLCHVDQAGHLLCGEEYCPLHRSMVTNKPSTFPVLVFAKHKDGHRVAVQVSVSPIHDEQGVVIGGLEIFRNVSALYQDLDRSRRIQEYALRIDIPENQDISVRSHYVPHDVVGGDFYAGEQIGEHRYAIFIADVMGHGVASALYTMQLRSIWEHHRSLLGNPAEFMGVVNSVLHTLISGDTAFATAALCIIDSQEGTATFVGAGHPPALILRADGSAFFQELPGLPLGIVDDRVFKEEVVRASPEDTLLFFSDGVVEARNKEGQEFGEEGLVSMLKGLGYPSEDVSLERIDEELLRFSNTLRLEDDLTLVEVRIKPRN